VAEEVFLAAEEVDDERRIDVGGCGDPAEGGLFVARFGEQGARRCRDLFAGVAGAGASPSPSRRRP
jgi:hypothetical protein